MSERQLIEALWWFIENVSEDTPDRTTLFFNLREHVRDYYARTTTEPAA